MKTTLISQLSVILSLMVAPAALVALPTIIYEQDFETVGSGWGIGSYTPGTISFADGNSSPAAFPTRSLSLSHIPENVTRLTSSAPSGAFSIPRTDDQLYTFQYDFRVSRADFTGFIYFQDRNQTSQLVLLLKLTPAGNIEIDYNNGSANVSTIFVEGYEVNTTYTVTFTTNPSTDLFSATVSGSAVTLNDVQFRRTLAGSSPFVAFNNLVIANDGRNLSGANFDLFVDNVIITAVPESSTTAMMIALGVFGVTLVVRRRRIRR